MAKFFVGFFMIGNYQFKCNASSFGPPVVENSGINPEPNHSLLITLVANQQRV
jgi:hypothetical protein